MSLAWHIAAMTRAKKMPELKRLLAGDKRKARRQTVDEQIAVARAWTAALARKS